MVKAVKWIVACFLVCSVGLCLAYAETKVLPQGIQFPDGSLQMTAAGGSSAVGPVPRTGQTSTVPLDPAPTGSDGDLKKGVSWPSPRFTDNGNGTVTDNLTGLIWLKNANCTDMVGDVDKSEGTLNWANALTWCNNLESGACGLTDNSVIGDWRLPNVKELHSLIDFGEYNPALPSDYPFTGVQSNVYWSSSSYASATIYGWNVNLYSGFVSSSNKPNTYYVWAVR